MKNSDEFAAVWRQNFSKPRPTVEREFAGLRGVFQRLPIQGWVRAGKVPQFLVRQLIKAQSGRDVFVEIQKESISEEEFNAALKFQREVAEGISVKPKIVVEDRPLKDGEISWDELVLNRPEVIDEMVTWVLSGCPDVPVRVKGGEVSLDDVSNFRDGGKGGASSEPSPRVQGVRKKAKRRTRDRG